MFYRFFRKIRRTARNWNTDVTRSDRNAVIQRVVAAAAKESKDNLNGHSESPARGRHQARRHWRRNCSVMKWRPKRKPFRAN